jgi:hypothetical protein
LFVVVKAGAQFVKDATGNERGRGELRIGMSKLLPEPEPKFLKILM